MVFDAEIREVLDVSTGQSRTLHQHVSLLLRRFSCQVVYHMHLLHIRGKHAHLQWGKKRGNRAHCVCVPTPKEFTMLKANEHVHQVLFVQENLVRFKFAKYPLVLQLKKKLLEKEHRIKQQLAL